MHIINIPSWEQDYQHLPSMNHILSHTRAVGPGPALFASLLTRVYTVTHTQHASLPPLYTRHTPSMPPYPQLYTGYTPSMPPSLPTHHGAHPACFLLYPPWYTQVIRFSGASSLSCYPGYRALGSLFPLVYPDYKALGSLLTVVYASLKALGSLFTVVYASLPCLTVVYMPPYHV